MKANELCPGKHLEAADLDGETEVTMADLTEGEVGEEKEVRWRLHFKEFSRPMVINRTNLKRLIKMFGGETNDWMGKKVTIYPTTCEFKGKETPCLRVKEK